MNPTADPLSKSTTNDNGASDRMRDAIDQASHKVGEYARTAGDRLGDAASSVRDRVSRTGRSAREMVNDYPIRSLAIGVGVGIVLGMLLSRAMR